MQVAVLGATEVRRDGQPVDLGTRKQRALLAALAMHRGRAVPVDLIVDLLWGDAAPGGVTATLQAYVAGLRKALEPERERRAPATLLVTVGAGYALQVTPDQLDAARFDAAVRAEHRRLGRPDLLAPSPLDAAELSALAGRLDDALALWRGEPYLELEDAPDALAERTRLGEQRLVAVEDRIVARLALGEHATVAGELESLTSAYPMRERLWALRALALTRSGRQADALEVLRTVRTVLDDELGLEPSAELRSLQTAVLRQAPELAWTPPREMVVVAAPATADPAATPSTPSTPAAPASEPAEPAFGWPLVGRTEQLAALEAALDRAVGGELTFAGLTGDPGIGKTRLAGELMARARARGVRVLVGRCSQDDGAPPLWPWRSVLRALGQELAAGGEDEPGAQFRLWDGIREALLDAARQQPLLVVLDDLHWADASTLRTLALLAESDQPAPLMVLATRRSHPEATGVLADVVSMLARRHALRIPLEGLDAAESAEVVAAVARARPSGSQAGELRERTDGNPFFLVEYARLALEGGDLGRLLAEPDPPTAVQDVLVRRVSRLPEDTQTLLRSAAVLGRQFDLDTLSRLAGVETDDAFDRLEVAGRAGLVREEAVDAFTFTHALVRDTLYTGWSPSRRARAHARAAEVVAAGTGRQTEAARHWLAAGPQHAARAWPAAVAAARQVRVLHDHEQAAELLAAALTSQQQDPAAGPEQRYDVLMALVDAYRWTADWPALIATIEQAIEVARALDDRERLARAAIATTMGALWQSAAHGETNPVIVGALRQCLSAYAGEDDPLRCRVMLSLANELYYGAPFAERQALVEEGLAMAARIGDPALLLDANQVAFNALWAPQTAEARLGFASTAMRLAREVANEQAFVVSATLRAVAEHELGRVAAMWESVALAKAEAQRVRLPYGLLVLELMELPWWAMRGAFAACEEQLVRIRRLDEQMSLLQSGEATASAQLALRLWDGHAAELGEMLATMQDSSLQVTALLVMCLVRGGRLDDARRHFAARRIDLSTEDWFSMLNWGAAAEVALWMGDADLAAAAYARLAPYAGRTCCAGSGNALGPVDGFLALAARAVGERELAGRHAERALALMDEWDVPLAADWFRDQRRRFQF